MPAPPPMAACDVHPVLGILLAFVCASGPPWFVPAAIHSRSLAFVVVSADAPVFHVAPVCELRPWLASTALAVAAPVR